MVNTRLANCWRATTLTFLLWTIPIPATHVEDATPHQGE